MGDDSEKLNLADITDHRDLAAGNFADWLHDTRSALAVNGEADVPCGECNACCRSGYFIHVGLEESEARAHIPEELLFAAPGRSRGTLLMGYDENGHCPMLVDGACSIYEVRPQACRNYDCRVFAAAKISVGDNDKPLVALQASRWTFDYSAEVDRVKHSAVALAADFVDRHIESLFGATPGNSTQVAIFALKVYDVFLELADESREVAPILSEEGIVEAIKQASKLFDSAKG